MPSEYRRKTSFGLNLTPLIDVVFLLLVFFMLTAHFVEERALDVDLPEAEANAAEAEPPQVEIIITADGNLLLNGKKTEPEALEAGLRDALSTPGPGTVQLRGDRAAHLGLAVQVMDAARKVGAKSMDIVTLQP